MVDSINFYNNVANLMDNAIEETRKIIKELPKQETEGEVSVSPGRALTPKKGQKCDVLSKLGEPGCARVYRSANHKSVLITQEFPLTSDINDEEIRVLEGSINENDKIKRQVSYTRI